MIIFQSVGRAHFNGNGSAICKLCKY